MRLHVLSDLHLEFGKFAMPQTGADVLVLAGDVGTNLDGLTWAIEQSLDRPVIYVAGNHEYYGRALPQLTMQIRQLAKGTNVHFLENSQVLIGGVRFLGCTLWTDFALFGAERRQEAMEEAGQVMIDYRIIRRSPQYRRLSPQDTATLHQQSRMWLMDKLHEPFEGPTVVVTHHAPSRRSIPPAFAGDVVSAAYASELEEAMDGARVSLWIHGHTHYCMDYNIHGTRVVTNQRGYNTERVEGFRPELVLEV